MNIFISTDENSVIQGWASARGAESDIEVEVADDHPILHTLPRLFKYIDGQVIKDEDIVLSRRKASKNVELNKACNADILAGFSHEINGNTYWFSYDMEAQGNFRDGKEVLRDGLVPALPWTVREGGVNGPYTRIDIDYATMQQLAIVIMNHKVSKISKYRDSLMPLVTAASTPEEVDAITWEDDKIYV
jgi:hypothetical protein